MAQKAAKLIRILTVAPIMAGIMVTLLYVKEPLYYASPFHFAAAIFFLVLMPLLAYPVAWIVPKIKAKGREGERTLAIVFAVTGYVLGTVFSLVFGGAAVETAVYLTYLLSGVAIALFSFVFHIKGSGHACGVSGPVAILSFFLGLPYLCGYLLLGAVCRASVALKRHTRAQLVLGSAVPILAFALSCGILRIGF